MRSLLVLMLIAILPAIASSYQISDVQIKNEIIKQSISSYVSKIGNCPCPYNRDMAGHYCGKRSAWSRAHGQSPICFPDDVSKEMLENYKHNKLLNDTQDSSVSGARPATNGGTEDEGVKIKP
jgi:hypothetical protein